MILLAIALTFAAVDFTAYPGDAPISAPPAKPLLTGPAAKHATRIREAAVKPADFNGHYRVARWGCGASCIQWAVIDQKTGRVILSPRVLSACTAAESEDAKYPDWLDYRLDSRLIVAYECEDTANGVKFDTRRFYAVQNGQLVSVRMERLKGELGAAS
ncbi:hypothetical protein BWI17_06615 [Betaproteobacteria bacterium GR16-43]|nr:hypothetical protein BWI17_06615 [Betaproteobacteria bacterium GR16-43]